MLQQSPRLYDRPQRPLQLAHSRQARIRAPLNPFLNAWIWVRCPGLRVFHWFCEPLKHGFPTSRRDTKPAMICFSSAQCIGLALRP